MTDFAKSLYPIKNTSYQYGNKRRFQFASRLLQVAVQLFFLQNLHKISHLLTIDFLKICDRKFQKKVVDGIYKITLQRTKNANYSVFCTFSSPKIHSSNENTMKNTMANQKCQKTLLNQSKIFFVNAVCSHIGPEYFLEHIKLN